MSSRGGGRWGGASREGARGSGWGSRTAAPAPPAPLASPVARPKPVLVASSASSGPDGYHDDGGGDAHTGRGVGAGGEFSWGARKRSMDVAHVERAAAARREKAGSASRRGGADRLASIINRSKAKARGGSAEPGTADTAKSKVKSSPAATAAAAAARDLSTSRMVTEPLAAPGDSRSDSASGRGAAKSRGEAAAPPKPPAGGEGRGVADAAATGGSKGGEGSARAASSSGTSSRGGDDRGVRRFDLGSDNQKRRYRPPGERRSGNGDGARNWSKARADGDNGDAEGETAASTSASVTSGGRERGFGRSSEQGRWQRPGAKDRSEGSGLGSGGTRTSGGPSGTSARRSDRRERGTRDWGALGDAREGRRTFGGRRTDRDSSGRGDTSRRPAPADGDAFFSVSGSSSGTPNPAALASGSAGGSEDAPGDSAARRRPWEEEDVPVKASQAAALSPVGVAGDGMDMWGLPSDLLGAEDGGTPGGDNVGLDRSRGVVAALSADGGTIALGTPGDRELPFEATEVENGASLSVGDEVLFTLEQVPLFARRAGGANERAVSISRARPAAPAGRSSLVAAADAAAASVGTAPNTVRSASSGREGSTDDAPWHRHGSSQGSSGAAAAERPRFLPGTRKGDRERGAARVQPSPIVGVGATPRRLGGQRTPGGTDSGARYHEGRHETAGRAGLGAAQIAGAPRGARSIERGTVFKLRESYGFLQPQDGGDVQRFFHARDVRTVSRDVRAMETLHEGDFVVYTVIPDDRARRGGGESGRLRATDVYKVDSEAEQTKKYEEMRAAAEEHARHADEVTGADGAAPLTAEMESLSRWLRQLAADPDKVTLSASRLLAVCDNEDLPPQVLRQLVALLAGEGTRFNRRAARVYEGAVKSALFCSPAGIEGYISYLAERPIERNSIQRQALRLTVSAATELLRFACDVPGADRPRFEDLLARLAPLRERAGTSAQEIAGGAGGDDTTRGAAAAAAAGGARSVLPPPRAVLLKGATFGAAATRGAFSVVDQYLAALTALAHQSLAAPLRAAAKDISQRDTSSSVYVYTGVRLTGLVPSAGGVRHRLQFRPMRSVNWESSRRLRFGSTLLLSPDGFTSRGKFSLVWASVATRDVKQLRTGFVDVTVAPESVAAMVPGRQYVLLDSRDASLAVAYSTLKGLSRLNDVASSEEAEALALPQLASVVDNQPPNYLLGVAEFTFSNVCAAVTDQVDILSTWPDLSSEFDSSQSDALRAALTNRVAAISGGPGTGKSYVRSALLRLLHTNVVESRDRGPVVVVSSSGSRLNRVMEDINSFATDIVHIGAEALGSELKSRSLDALCPPPSVLEAPAEALEALNAQLQEWAGSVDIRWFDRERLRQCARPSHVSSLMTRMSEVERGMRSLVSTWLGREPVSILGRDKAVPAAKESAAWSDGDEEAKGTELDRRAVLSPLQRAGGSAVIRVAGPLLACPIPNDREVAKAEDVGDDVWALSIPQRVALFKVWAGRWAQQRLAELSSILEDFSDRVDDLHESSRSERVRVLESATFVGVTVDALSTHADLLQAAGASVVVVDDAADVTEADLVGAVGSWAEQLVLIGNRQSPRIGTVAAQAAEHLGVSVSLLDRVRALDGVFVELTTQHRSCASITGLLGSIYGEPKTSEVVQIRGLASNVFFIDHAHEEEPAPPASVCNPHEAAFVASLCSFLRRQGYQLNKVAALTFSPGQVPCIRRALRSSGCNSVTACTVDEFGDREADIVILSVARCNAAAYAGNAAATSRVIAALSRSRSGLYVIGDGGMLWTASDLWQDVLRRLQRSGCVGPTLVLEGGSEATAGAEEGAGTAET